MQNVRIKAFCENDAKSDELQRNENVERSYNPHCRVLSYKFGHVLRFMKLTGTYYGGTSLTDDPQVNSCSFCSRFYCGIMLLGQWTLAIQAVTSIYFEGLTNISKLYLLLIYSVFYSQGAVLTTISLSILPRSQRKSSRFRRFTDNLFRIDRDFSGVTTKSINRLLALVILFFVFNLVALLLMDVYGLVSIARFRPWNGLFHYRFLHLLFGPFVSCSWSVPFVLFCASCELMEGMFDPLERKVSSESTSSLNIGWLRQEHQKLCEIVALADKVFSPFLLATIIFDVPLLCINFHQLLKSPRSKDTVFVLSLLYWCVSLTAKLAIIMKFGVRVNEKVSRFNGLYVKKDVFNRICFSMFPLNHFSLICGEGAGTTKFI